MEFFVAAYATVAIPNVKTPPAASSTGGVCAELRRKRSPDSTPLPINRTGWGNHSGSPAIQSSRKARARTFLLLIARVLLSRTSSNDQDLPPPSCLRKEDLPRRKSFSYRARSRPHAQADPSTLRGPASRGQAPEALRVDETHAQHEEIDDESRRHRIDHADTCQRC